MEVKRICQWCGKPFIAQKTTTNYCSPQCSKRGYKHRMKERRMELRQIQEMVESKEKAGESGILHIFPNGQTDGCLPSVYLQVGERGQLRASRLSSRMSLIRRADIELMYENQPYEAYNEDDVDITEYYTAEQIAEKYKVNAKWVWTYTREHDVPKVKIRQFNYYSKEHIDAAFAKYKTDDALTEWYTPEEIEKNYGMTRVAIRSHVYRNNIPSKKEHGQIFYSKLHFDLSKNSAEESKAEYYTVKEAMEKFNLSRDSVYNILQFHQISREKNGRFVRFLKVDFDRVMGVRK